MWSQAGLKKHHYEQSQWRWWNSSWAILNPKRWCCKSAALICQQTWKTQQWPQDWKKSIFIPVPKKGSAKECSNYHTVAFISHTSRVMLKILQARLQQYVNCELPDVQAGFRKGRGTRDQIANICRIIEKVRVPEKHLFHWLHQAFDCVDHNKLWKILQEMGISNHLICLLRNLYAGQEATVRTGHGTTDWFQTGKGVCQGCILSPCLFNLYAEYIMWNAGLDEAQAGIKIARKNINNSHMQMTPPLWQKVKRNWRASWWKWKRRLKKLA